MRRIPLTESRVLEIELYREPSFDLLLRFIIGRRFEIDAGYTRASRLVPGLMKYHWRAATPRLTHAASRPGFVEAHDVIHSGIHHLVTCRYGPGLVARPALCLLGEALASSSNLFFTLTYHLRDGVDHPLVREQISTFARTAAVAGRPFIRAYNRLLKAPFDAYRESVRQMFALSMSLLEVAQRKDSTSFDGLSKIEGHIRHSSMFPFLTRFDYANFVLYTLAFCGGRGSSADLAAVSDCRRALERARSMSGFLTTLTRGVPTLEAGSSGKSERAAKIASAPSVARRVRDVPAC